MPLPLTASGLRDIEVLVVDDDPRSLDLVLNALISCGVTRATRAPSSRDAHRLLGARRFDAILMECDLRDDDAFALARRIRGETGAFNALAPIVMLSATTPLSRINMARDAGVNFTLAKPLAPAILQARLLWIARHERGHIETESYHGPDRRVRSGPPPPGVEERREANLRLVATPERELSQSEIDGLFN